MNATLSPEKSSLTGITVKLTREEHRLLRAVIFSEGFHSFQDYFRSFLVRKIKESSGEAADRQGHDYAAQ
jgi:hypothetical protein